MVGIIFCLGVASVGVGVTCSWITTRHGVVVLLGLVAGLTLVCELLVLISTITGVPKRRWLAAVVEKIDPRFQDRLNTLLFLESRRREPRVIAFRERIAEQARRVLNARTPARPFSALPSLAWLCVFLAVFGVSASFNLRYVPWKRLQPGSDLLARHQIQPPPATLTSLPTNAIEPPRSWGEVRITRPGGDLRLTKVDVVPLAIEAAANQNLKEVGWYSSVNGKPEQAHPLPAPKDPKYGIYQPTLFLDELELADWDVLTYYANARTESSNHYASEIYFIEVRPFREDILKMPGGEGGAPYQSINAISSLIGHQQRIIRQTHQYAQRAGEPKADSAERANLAQAELDLGDAAQHLYADMAAKMENQPIGQALENLAKAQGSLDDAGQALKDDFLGPAQDHEREALADLVATRKNFQRIVSDHPQDFSSPPGESPIANASDKFNQMTEFRDETKSASEFVQKLLKDQKQVEQQASDRLAETPSDLATREKELERALREFAAQHPKPFNNSRPQSEQAQRALQQAGQAWQAGNSESGAATRRATRDLESLGSAMQRQFSSQQTTEAYRLEQMLKAQIRSLDQLASSQSGAPAQQAASTAQATRDIIDELKRNLDQDPDSKQFGQPLHDALNDRKKSELDQKLADLQQAQADQERQARATESRDALKRLDQAFVASEPQALQQARNTDSLKPDPNSGFAEGLSQLDNLLRQLEQGRNLPPADQQKQARQALSNLQAGLENQFGQNSQGEGLVRQLQDMLGNQQALNPETLRRLLEQLEHFSAEARTTVAANPDELEVLNQDPLRLPQAYRDRIESYFRKLSEK
jgi:hypothetical protein